MQLLTDDLRAQLPPLYVQEKDEDPMVHHRRLRTKRRFHSALIRPGQYRIGFTSLSLAKAWYSQPLKQPLILQLIVT